MLAHDTLPALTKQLILTADHLTKAAVLETADNNDPCQIAEIFARAHFAFC